MVVGNGTAEHARWFVEDEGVTVTVLTDPDRVAFRAIGARRGAASSLGPATVAASLRAFRRGFRASGVKGDALQQGAVWIVGPGGELVWHHTSRWAGDHPDPAEILSALLRRRGPARERER